MDDQIKCAIIQDLLPHYVEGMTSGVTNEAIEAHISACPACKVALESARAARERQQQTPEMLAQRRRAQLRRRMATTGICLGLVVLVVGLSFLFTFVFGKRAGTSMLSVDKVYAYEDGSMAFSVVNANSALAHCYSTLEYEQSGTVICRAYFGLPSFVHAEGNFIQRVPAQGDRKIERIYLEGRSRADRKLVWERGMTVKPFGDV
nr:zf-HC2 domain-containing protein [Maliibacterium massiliense]